MLTYLWNAITVGPDGGSTIGNKSLSTNKMVSCMFKV